MRLALPLLAFFVAGFFQSPKLGFAWTNFAHGAASIIGHKCHCHADHWHEGLPADPELHGLVAHDPPQDGFIVRPTWILARVFCRKLSLDPVVVPALLADQLEELRRTFVSRLELVTQRVDLFDQSVELQSGGH